MSVWKRAATLKHRTVIKEIQTKYLLDTLRMPKHSPILCKEKYQEMGFWWSTLLIQFLSQMEQIGRKRSFKRSPKSIRELFDSVAPITKQREANLSVRRMRMIRHTHNIIHIRI